MMRVSRSMVLLILPTCAAMLLAGCTPPTPKATPPAAPQTASPQQASAIADDIVRTIPNAKIGHVAGVMASNKQLAVAGISITDAPIGSSIQFVDASQHGIANGTVSSTTNVETGFLIVDYVETSDGRTPMSGDIAVFIPGKP